MVEESTDRQLMPLDLHIPTSRYLINHGQLNTLTFRNDIVPNHSSHCRSVVITSCVDVSSLVTDWIPSMSHSV
jgi:hypothetical protein